MRIAAVVGLGLASALLAAACYSEPQHAHAPRAPDLEAWRDVPASQLQTQPRFAELQHDVRKLADGSEIWVYSTCDAARSDVKCFTSPTSGAASSEPRGPASCGTWSATDVAEKCCFHEFAIRGGRISRYQTEGPCEVGCGTWPKPKLYECLDRVRSETTAAIP